MRQESRTVRQKEIENLAYALLEEAGFAGTTMQAIAKRAGASMETLYNWYGNKDGLFRALVAGNVEQVRQTLEPETNEKRSGLETLAVLGPQLLELLTGERAIALNRAAAADKSGELGAAIVQGGRETVAPLLGALFAHIADEELPGISDLQETTEIYLGVLIGDLQIRRVIGQIAPLNEQERLARSQRAIVVVTSLYAQGH